MIDIYGFYKIYYVPVDGSRIQVAHNFKASSTSLADPVGSDFFYKASIWILDGQGHVPAEVLELRLIMGRPVTVWFSNPFFCTYVSDFFPSGKKTRFDLILIFNSESSMQWKK